MSDPSCPWSGFAPANLHFCEENTCTWIAEPANTWSNVGFLVVGIALLRIAKREGWGRASWLGPIAIATGISSIAFHATDTFVGQALDQGVMLFESALFVVLDVGRWTGWPDRRLAACYAALVGLSVALLVAFRTVGIALFAGEVVAFAALEVALLLRTRSRGAAAASYTPLALVAGTFAVSYALWWVDKLGIICDPKNHLFGPHAAWHLLGAASFWFWYQFFAQFERHLARGRS